MFVKISLGLRGPLSAFDAQGGAMVPVPPPLIYFTNCPTQVRNPPRQYSALNIFIVLVKSNIVLCGLADRIHINIQTGIKVVYTSLKIRCLVNWTNCILTLARTCYFPILLHPTSYRGLTTPYYFAPNWDRVVGLGLNESLGRFEFNGTRVDLFRSYLDHSRSGLSKKDSNFEMYRLSQITFELRKIADLFKHHRVSLLRRIETYIFLPRKVKLKIWPSQINTMIALS